MAYPLGGINLAMKKAKKAAKKMKKSSKKAC